MAKTARKPISNSVRFEVFKRDSFTCQYCGKKVPDVILHVDHIHPVCEGGDNNIVNLITSCVECNSGKRGKKLNDTEKIQRQYAGALDAGAKAQQIKMIAKARKQLVEAQKEAIEVATQCWEGLIGGTCSEYEHGKIRSAISRFDLDAVISGLEYVHRRNIGDRYCTNRMRIDAIDWLVGAIKYLAKPEYAKEAVRVRNKASRKFNIAFDRDYCILFEVLHKHKWDVEWYVDKCVDASEFRLEFDNLVEMAGLCEEGRS